MTALILLLVLASGCDSEAGPDAVAADAAMERPASDGHLDLGPRPDRPALDTTRPTDTPLTDGATPKPDEAAPKPDKAAPKPDKAAPKPDKAAPKPDKFIPTPDKAAPKPDKFIPKPDKFIPKPDKFIPKPDFFVPTPDIFVPTPDIFVPKPDLPTPPDIFVPKPDKFVPKPDIFVPKPDLPIPPDSFVPKPDLPIPPDSFAPKPDLPIPPDSAPPDSGGVTYTGSFPKGKTGYVTANLGVAGHTRKVVLYVPGQVGAKPPVLITLHGTHGEAQYMIQSSYAKDLADSKKVLILSPQGRKMTKGDWDNHYTNDIYWETYPNVSPSTNPDLQLIRAMIVEAQKSYNADPRRIYVLGHSNGAFFSILAAMALPNEIAAFVSNSGGLVRCPSSKTCSFKGSATSCASLSQSSAYTACNSTCAGPEKPGPVATSGRKPPGYLAHSSDDNVLSVYYTCVLSARLSALNYTQSVKIYSGNGHSMPYLLAVNAWSFLSQHKLP